jgi:hypothetical protein
MSMLAVVGILNLTALSVVLPCRQRLAAPFTLNVYAHTSLNHHHFYCISITIDNIDKNQHYSALPDRFSS